MEKFLFVLAMSVMAISQVTALRCWRCSSDISNGGFCEDPFNVTLMSEHQRKWSYVDCVLHTTEISPNLLARARPVCKKIVQRVREKEIYARACSWEIMGEAPDACRYAATPPDVRILSCETCTRDGCNGDTSRSMLPYDPYRITQKPETADAMSRFNFSGLSLGLFAAIGFLLRF